MYTYISKSKFIFFFKSSISNIPFYFLEKNILVSVEDLIIIKYISIVVFHFQLYLHLHLYFHINIKYLKYLYTSTDTYIYIGIHTYIYIASQSNTNKNTNTNPIHLSILTIHNKYTSHPYPTYQPTCSPIHSHTPKFSESNRSLSTFPPDLSTKPTNPTHATKT